MIVNIIIAAFICILAFITAYAFIPAKRHRLLFSFVIFTSVVIRFAVVFYIYKDGTNTFGTDGLLYHNEAIKVMKQLASGSSLFGIDYSYTLYTVFVGIVYSITGINRYLASYFNIIFAFVSGLLLLRIAMNHGYSLLNSYIISACFLFFPNLVLWTTDTRKEALLMLACFSCWFSVQKLIMTLQDNRYWLKNIFRVLFICAMMWLTTVIRIYILIPVITGVVISFMMMYKKTMQKRYLSVIAAILAAGILLLVTVVYPMTENYHAINFPKEQEENVSDDIAGKLSTLFRIISEKNIPGSIVSCLLLPNPADVDIADINYSKALQLLVQIDMIIWYICLVLILSGIYSALKARNSFLLGLLTFICVYILINSVIAESVADTVYRYRSAIVGLTLLFIDVRILKDLLTRIGFFLSCRPEDKLHTYAKHEVLSLLQNRKNLL